MAVNELKLTADISARLRKRFRGTAADAVTSCTGISCDVCGDVCPARALKQARARSPKLRAVMRGTAKTPLLFVRYVSNSQQFRNGDLKQAKIATIEKAIRRSLDRLNNSNVTAVFVVGAVHDGNLWCLAVRAVVSGIDKPTLGNALSGGYFKIQGYSDLGMVIQRVVLESLAPVDVLDSVLEDKMVRGEYYAWGLNFKPGARTFFYGLDRYLNRLSKKARPLQSPKPKRKRPYPRWLTPYQFGNHPQDCRCHACGGPGRYS